MTVKTWRNRATLAMLCGVVAALAVPAMQAGAAEDVKNPATKKFVTKAPRGAVVLIGAKSEDIAKNWYERNTKNDAAWTMDAEGAVSNNKHDITSKQEFGDLFIHVEFRCPVDHGGNSGVAPMGRYEIQILNSFDKPVEAHECGALYSQKPAMVNASKKVGEWQTYDMTFRAPRFDAAGAVTEKARITVYQNGTLIQDNAEFSGPTGIQYGEYKGEVKTAPLVLQGDHDPVQFRNVWVKLLTLK